MTQINLTNAHIKQLKAKAHHLNPVVMVGDKGLTDTLIEETVKSLAHHELIKVRFAGDKAERTQLIEQLAEATESTVIQTIGRMAVLFKRNHEAPKIFF